MATEDPRNIFRGVSNAMRDTTERLDAALVSLRGGAEAYRRAAAIAPTTAEASPEATEAQPDPLDTAIALLDEARRLIRTAQQRRA